MSLYDQHLHTRFSTDSETPPADNVRAAVARGLAGLTFTDHLDTHPDEWPLCRYDYAGLAAEVAACRAALDGRIFIGHGIEVCYQPGQMDRILPFLAGRRFDLVILSVHYACGRALHVPEQWEDWSAEQVTRSYLQTVLEAVRMVARLHRGGSRVFDVLGHLDLVKRYTRKFRDGFDIRPYGDLVDRILEVCLEADLVPEVNTSSLRQSLPEPMPADWVVRRYAQLGGTMMSLGSDAHRPADIGAGIPEGAALLRSQGIAHLAVFRNRERAATPLD